MQTVTQKPTIVRRCFSGMGKLFSNVAIVSALFLVTLTGCGKILSNFGSGFKVMTDPLTGDNSLASSAAFNSANAVLKTNCATCHFAGSSPSFDFQNENEAFAAVFKSSSDSTAKPLFVRGDIVNSRGFASIIGSGAVGASMPRSGAPLSQSDLNILRNWILNAGTAPLSCGSIQNGQSTTRVRFQSARVAFGQACVSEVQTQTCENGLLGDFDGSFTQVSCNVEAAASCNGVASGQTVTRTMYSSATVPYGQTCAGASQLQSALCTNGNLGPYSGTYTSATCTVAAPASCGAVASGQSAIRTMFSAATVPAGQACASVSQVQSALCTNGTLSPYSGTFTFANCTVNQPSTGAACGSTASGQSVTRTMYSSATVPYGQTCASVSQVQSALCTNGTLGAYSGTYKVASCTVSAPASCGSVASGQSATRTMYSSASVPFGQSCSSVSELQSALCTNGTLGTYSGTFKTATCSVAAAASCGSVASGQSVTRTMFSSATVPYGQSCVSQVQSALCTNGTLGPYSGTYASANCVTSAPDAPTAFGKAQVVLQQKCIGCHGPGGSMASKSFVFATEDQAFATAWFKRGDISSAALVRTKGSGSMTATMPDNSVSWTQAEFDILKNWIVNAGTVVVPPVNTGTSITEKPAPELACSNDNDTSATDNARLSKVQVGNTLAMLFGDDVVTILPPVTVNPVANMDVSVGTVNISNQTTSAMITWASTSGAKYHIRVTESQNGVATTARLNTYSPFSGSLYSGSGIYLYVDNLTTNNVSFAVRAGYEYHFWVHSVINNVLSTQKDLYFNTTLSSSSSSLAATKFEALPSEREPWKFDKIGLDFSLLHANANLDLGIAVAETVYNNATKRAAVFGTCANSATIAASCVDAYLAGFSKKILRRPLSAAEITKSKEVFYSSTVNSESFISLLAYQLNHPDFLIRWELAGPSSGSGPLTDAERLFKVTNYELASKIAFMITDTGPDDLLLAAAADGSIATDSGLRTQVSRLMTLPKAREKFANLGFFWSGDELNFNFTKMPTGFVGSLNVTNLGAAAVDETRKFMQYIIFDGKKGFADLLTSKVSMASDPVLASVYNHSPAGVVPATFGDDRKGYFNRFPFLYNVSSRSSIILRGVRYRKTVLCEQINSPPPDVLLARNLDELTEEQIALMSTRDLTHHKTIIGDVSNPATVRSSCIGCHQFINPTANILENFDSLGRYRTQEKVFSNAGALTATVPVKTQDTIPLWTGSQVVASGYSDFVEQIATSSSVKACFTKKLVSYSNSLRVLDSKDACKMKRTYDELVKTNGSLFDAIVTSVANPSTRYKRVGQ